MMKTKIILSCSLFACNMAGLLAQDKMFVNLKTGPFVEYPLQNIRTLTFPLGNVSVNKIAGSSETQPVSNTRSIWFRLSPLGLQENENNKNAFISLYPNPLHGSIVKLQFNAAHSGAVQIELVNSSGTIEKQDSSPSVSGMNEIEINVAGLASGVYFCHVKTSDKVETKKLIKY